MKDTVRLRHLAEINPPTPEFDTAPSDAPMTFMPLETVWADSRVDLTRKRPKSEVDTGYVRFRAGDVLCPKVTPTFQAGRSALIPPLETPAGAASTEVHVVRPRPDISDPRFVRYCLLAPSFLTEGVSAFQGVAGLQRVSQEFLSDLSIRSLSVGEQRRIADFLDDQVARIDKIIAAREHQLSVLSGLRLHLLGEAASRLGMARGGITPWFPYWTTGWQVKKLSWITKCLDGSRVPLNSEERADRSGPFPYYGASTIVDSIDDYLFDESLVLVGEDGAALENPAFDVVQQVEGKVWVNNHAHVLRPTGVGGDYLAWYLRSVDRGALTSGATRAKITQQDLMSLRVVVPSADDEADLVRMTMNLAAQHSVGVDLLASHVARLQELKRSLITAAVTGEFDVSTADGTQVLAGVSS